MLFTSYEFILFLAIVLTVYYVCPGKYQWGVLLAASLFFYWMADPRYLIFIITTAITIYIGTIKIDDAKESFSAKFSELKSSLSREDKKVLKEEEKKKEKRIMLLVLLINIGILAILKYSNFALKTFLDIRAMVEHKESYFNAVNILIPMGISFYTFQAVGYLIDVYNGRIKAERSFLRLLLFISFFPQLVQGPISRYSDLALTLYESHTFEYRRFSFGLQRVLWGFFKKLVIADRLLIAVNTMIDDPITYTGGYVVLLMFFYAIELYADFTGGIDITIGIAQAMGIRVAENFERPYFSKNIKEYWKRWHITMGTWFTDYIFYPLSVSPWMRNLNKKARARFGERIGSRIPVYISSFVVWFTTGLWHGASWNFIVWGLGNFVVIMISEELTPFYNWFHRRYDTENSLMWKIFRILRTNIIMCCLRLFDCYRSVPLTFKMFGEIFNSSNYHPNGISVFIELGLNTADYLVLIIASMVILGVSMIQRKGCVRERISKFPTIGRYAIWFGMFLATLMFGIYGIGYDKTQFIYNQF